MRKQEECLAHRDGLLVLGRLEGRVISLSGSYSQEDGSAYLAELAVTPELQRSGYGLATARKLIEMVKEKAPRRMKIRTSKDNNEKVLNWYTLAGFTPETGSECAPHLRRDGIRSLKRTPLPIAAPSIC